MPYIGLINALSITEQNAGDNVWNRVHVTENNTTIQVEFAELNPSSLYIELIVDSGLTGVTFGEGIEWIGGVYPGYIPGATEIWKFFQNETGTIFGTKIGTEGQVVSELATDAVNTDNIVDSAVTTAKIADESITLDKLASNSVNSSKIVDGAVTSGKLHSSATSLFATAAQGATADTAIQPDDYLPEKFLHLQYQVSSGTHGGSTVLGSWNNLSLNTEVYDDIGSTLSSNQFTLPAGTYYIEAVQEFFAVNQCRIRLYNVTDSAEALMGMTAYTRNDIPTSTYSAMAADLSGRITINDTKTFVLQYRAANSRTSNGLGTATGFGVNEIYTDIKVWRIS